MSEDVSHGASPTNGGGDDGTPDRSAVLHQHNFYFRRRAGLRETTDTAAAVVVGASAGCIGFTYPLIHPPTRTTLLSAVDASAGDAVRSDSPPMPTPTKARFARVAAQVRGMAPGGVDRYAASATAGAMKAEGPTPTAAATTFPGSAAVAPSLAAPLGIRPTHGQALPASPERSSPLRSCVAIACIDPGAENSTGTFEQSSLSTSTASPANSRAPQQQQQHGTPTIIPTVNATAVGGEDRFAQRRIPLPPPAVAPTSSGRVTSVHGSPAAAPGVALSSAASLAPSAESRASSRERRIGSGGAARLTPLTGAAPLAATAEAESAADASAASGQRRHTLPPLSSPVTRPRASLPLSAFDSAEREQAHMVRGLMQWGRGGGRRNQFLKVTSGSDAYPCALTPLTIHSSRPARALASSGAAVAGGVADTLGDRPDSGLNVAPTGAVAPTTPTPPSWTRAEHCIELHRDEEEQQPDLRWQQHPHQQQSHHFSRSSATQPRSRTVSRCSTPDIPDLAGFLRKGDASPKRPPGSSRRAHVPERTFPRPSASPLQGEGQWGSGSWSRSGTLPMNSSRHTNTSTLTISCAPALGSFSTNSENSLLF
ncbi:hypothetical protein NESM_000281300 [Novymonas esmeraldas]|uniref:Uncharacterized protein n=1 Tax=Novymonas esmeraldas TaxID=1808958 RepID=A0AAW0FEX8_9TRYP